MSLPAKEEGDTDAYDLMPDEEKAKPYIAYIGWDDSTWNDLQINPDYDAETYGTLPTEAPPEYPIPENAAGVPKYIWDGKNGNDNWIVDPSF